MWASTPGTAQRVTARWYLGRHARLTVLRRWKPLPPTWGSASDFALVSGHLHVEGGEEKMSKSLRNYVTIKVTRSSRAPRCQPAAVLGGLVWQATPSCC